LEKDKVKGVVIWILGWFFIGLGILGLFLPFLQGVLFIMIGLAILSTRSRTIQRFLKVLENRYPQYYEKVVAWRKKVGDWWEKRWPMDNK
jgi:uncharacterized membrane protein YbaN (DUF454 family)